MAHRKYSAAIAGVITGVRMASKSLEPSLMPRSAIDQGIIMAGSFATGYIAGSAVARVVGLIPMLGGALAMRVVGVVAAGAKSAQVVRGADEESEPEFSEASAWAVTATDVLGSIAVVGAVSGAHTPVVGAITGAAATAATVSDIHAALQVRDDDVDPAYLLTATGTALGMVTAVAGVVAAIGVSGRLARRASSTVGLNGVLVSSGVSLGVVCLLGLGAKTAMARVLGSLAAGNQAVEVAYSEPPEAPEVSGSPDSLIPYDSLGLQGRRLVSEVTSADSIKEIMGEPARKNPVRVFVGIDSADSVAERVELAIEELRRSGGFDRSTIIAASPAGTGYVNYIAIEAAELMSRGDVATVAIQYGSLPSMLSISKVEYASRLYEELVKRLRQEIDGLDHDVALYAYGESLGAQTCQNALDAASDGSGLLVDGALWVGTPFGTALFERLTADGVPVFDSPSDLQDFSDDEDTTPVALFLNHDNDPVTKFSPSMFFTMPDWLKTAERGRGMNVHQRWLPGIAFWQGLIDTKNAATVIPGEFNSTGHDYRADLASFVSTAFRFEDVSDEQMERIEERLRHSEVERAANISEGKLQTA